MDEVTRLQKLLSLTSEGFYDQAKLPCIVLPAMKNTNIYDREDLIAKIDEYYQTMASSDQKPRAIALFGLGGVGKSQIALKYARKKIQERSLDVVLWTHSETATALAQSFTHLAIRLELPGANEQHHEKNKVLVLDWLQRTRTGPEISGFRIKLIYGTGAQWLLIFDNAESSDMLLQYWPLATDGCVLLTTRNHSLAFQPAGAGIEVPPFESTKGSEFLLNLLSMDIVKNLTSQEARSALELSQRLSGHALAISQMAGLIQNRGWSIEEFLQVYSRNAQKVDHKTSLETVWKLSFESLEAASSALLGTISFLMPDSIPQSLFQPSDPQLLPDRLKFCDDEIE